MPLKGGRYAVESYLRAPRRQDDRPLRRQQLHRPERGHEPLRPRPRPRRGARGALHRVRAAGHRGRASPPTASTPSRLQQELADLLSGRARCTVVESRRRPRRVSRRARGGRGLVREALGLLTGTAAARELLLGAAPGSSAPVGPRHSDLRSRKSKAAPPASAARRAEGEQHRSARPVRAHRRARRHLVEHGGVEHPVVQADHPPDELDEEGPHEQPVGGDRCVAGGRCRRRGHRSPRTHTARGHDVEPGFEQGRKAHPAVLAGGAEPGEDTGDQAAGDQGGCRPPRGAPANQCQRPTGRTRRWSRRPSASSARMALDLPAADEGHESASSQEGDRRGRPRNRQAPRRRRPGSGWKSRRWRSRPTWPRGREQAVGGDGHGPPGEAGTGESHVQADGAEKQASVRVRACRGRQTCWPAGHDLRPAAG